MIILLKERSLIPIVGERDDAALTLSINWLSPQFVFPSFCSPIVLSSTSKVLVTAPLHILRRPSHLISTTFVFNPICVLLLLLLSQFSALRPRSLRHALLPLLCSCGSPLMCRTRG